MVRSHLSQMTDPLDQPPTGRRRRPAVSPLLFLVCAAAINGCAILNANFRTVEDGALYRSGQMHAEALDRRMEQYDIKTVISLRKPEPAAAWYREERDVTASNGAIHHSVPLSMRRLPEPERLERLMSLFETSNGPILVHCEGGIHRASVASAAWVLARGGDVDEARKQLDVLFFNDAPIGRLLDLYDATGSDEPFSDWVRDTYPEVYRGATEPR